MNNKSKQEELKEQQNIEKNNKKEQEKLMKTILEKMGEGGELGVGIINENENEESNINANYNRNDEEYTIEDDSLLLHISKQKEINRKKNNSEQSDNNSSKNNNLDIIENKIKINYIKCTLSFLDKGKAVFITENDDIFCIPSVLLNNEIKIGNSYLFHIEIINILMKSMYQIENIQNKYSEWKF